MVVLTPIERENLQDFFFFYIFHRCSMCPPLVIRQTSTLVHLVPHACQHITVDQSHSSGDTVAKVWRLAGSGGTKTVSFINPQKKKSYEVKSGDRCGHRINASSSFPVSPIHLCGKFRLRYPRKSLYGAREMSC